MLSKIGLLAMILLFSGCAKTCNKRTANGGLFGSYPGDWIVVTYSGNHITDVWKMSNVMVQSEEHSDGWLFVDDHNNAIHVGGNTKAIRVNDKDAAQWNKYVEYHFEFNKVPYQQYVDSINTKTK